MFAQFPNGVCYSCPPYPPVYQLPWFASPCICIVSAGGVAPTVAGVGTGAEEAAARSPRNAPPQPEGYRPAEPMRSSGALPGNPADRRQSQPVRMEQGRESPVTPARGPQPGQDTSPHAAVGAPGTPARTSPPQPATQTQRR
jgi:hypothetical protein